MDSVITQGKELGTYFYMLTGGEPLVRKKDVIALCKSIMNCIFLAYTNGTLVDEELCRQMQEAGNLFLALSLEGKPEVNDLRRGEGVYGKVMHAMELLKETVLYSEPPSVIQARILKVLQAMSLFRCWWKKVAGILCISTICRLETRLHRNCFPQWSREHICTTESGKSAIWNMGRDFLPWTSRMTVEFVGGCIAGGRNYFHINANGDAEPCVFIHYSNGNIRENTILEILKQPLFMAYHNNQPFNDNMLRPCPMLENPEILQRLVKESGAHSTDLQSPETPEHLCGKCVGICSEMGSGGRKALERDTGEESFQILLRKNYIW